MTKSIAMTASMLNKVFISSTTAVKACKNHHFLPNNESFGQKLGLTCLLTMSLALSACAPAEQADNTDAAQSKTADDTQTTVNNATDTAKESKDNDSAAVTSTANTPIRIAAAANLSDVLPEIIDGYKADKNLPELSIEVTYGSSGKLYAQAVAGAPFDLFLSANQEFAQKLAIEMDTAKQGQQPFTYARGQLSLYSVTQPIKPLNEMTLTAVLKSQPNAKITIANPELAPYGASAKAYLQQQGLFDELMKDKRIIQGENIGQTFQYANTGNVDYGFVAQSQVTAIKATPQQFYILPPDSYPAILQDGVVTSDVPTAEDFANYLRSPAGQEYFAKAGYLPVK